LFKDYFFVANVCYFVNCFGEKLGITCSFNVECFFQLKVVTFVKCHKSEKKHFPSFLSGKEKAPYTKRGLKQLFMNHLPTPVPDFEGPQ
jgi:hypothetical protein